MSSRKVMSDGLRVVAGVGDLRADWGGAAASAAGGAASIESRVPPNSLRALRRVGFGKAELFMLAVFRSFYLLSLTSGPCIQAFYVEARRHLFDVGRASTDAAGGDQDQAGGRGSAGIQTGLDGPSRR